MNFISISFVVFFGLFFILYWFVFKNNLKLQNILILIGSYVFYGWSDWRFLTLLICVSVLNFYLGIYIAKETKYKQLLFYLGLILSIGTLAFFKYYNFFITSFNDVLLSLNSNLKLEILNLIIPLGISYFTFRILSYLIDINKGKIEPTKDVVVFFNYVSFFPTILSGPIDSSKDFIPQLEKKRVFHYSQASDGMRQILWGLFKKLVIADNIATITNHIFDNFEVFPSSTALLGAFLYAIQIYADFSGYTDMAIGFARLLGFKVTKNFDFPFFAQNIAEFWRKWHISLTSWLTEYVFTPLSIYFRDLGKLGLILAIVINFTICGIWHGANWTYVLFGFLHGLLFIPLILKGKMNKRKKIASNKLGLSIKEYLNMIGTFTLVVFTFIIFRAETVGQAVDYISRIFSKSLFSIPYFHNRAHGLMTLFLIFIFMMIEWLGKYDDYALARLGMKWKRPIRWALYYAILIAIFFLSGEEQQFIYFQF